MITLIRFYQVFISPQLHRLLALFTGTTVGCRHSPTCSQYALEAYQKYSFFKATRLSLSRLLSCHP